MLAFAVCFVLLFSGGAELSSRDLRTEEIRQIDEEIRELKEKKRGFEARALWAEDQAERMQFEERFTLETRQYFKMAEQYRQQAQLVQEEIDRLEKEKEKRLRGLFGS